jgi:hypothetical protein
MDFRTAGRLARRSLRFFRITAKVSAWIFRTIEPTLLPTSCICLSWLAYSFDEGAWSGFFWIPAGILIVRRKWLSVAAFLLLMPPAVLFAMNAIEYARGSPAFVNGNDVIWHPQRNIDPVTRIRSHYTSCGTRSGNSWLRSFANDLAETVMYRLIGPPPGAYTGPYPTQHEAEMAIVSGTKFQISVDWDRHIHLPTGTVILPRDWCHLPVEELLDGLGPSAGSDMQPSAVLWKGRCLIVKIPWMDNGDTGAKLCLIDAQKLEMFAMYLQPLYRFPQKLN